VKAEAVFLSEGVAKTVVIEVGKLARSEVLVQTRVCGMCTGARAVIFGRLQQ